jgi:DNA-binding Xre family transcriptional regulator
VSKLDYNKIKNFAAAKRIPIKELAKRCDLSEQGFHYMLKKQTMRVDTLEKICETLGVSMYELFDDSSESILSTVVSGQQGSHQKEMLDRLDKIIELLKVEKYHFQ